MFIELIVALSFLSLLVFAVPMRWKWWVAFGVTGAGTMLCLTEAVRTLTRGTDSVYREGTNLIFGLEYAVIDPLSAFFMILIALASLVVMLYARGYLKPYLAKKSGVQISLHYMSLVLMYFAMILVVVFRDGFGFLFSWELMTIASFLLILFDGERREVRRAALNYLIMMHIGFFFLLAAFSTLYAQGLPVSFDSLGAYFSGHATIPLFLLFLVGFGMKAGLFPLHVWLPEAHPAAPSHVSALMSGVMIKMGVYGILRVVSMLQSDLYAVGLILLVAGIVTGIWGILLAILQNDVKKILAYSSIENMGIIFIALGIGLIGIAQQNTLLALCGIGGALLHVMNHTLLKLLLFFGAGNLYSQLHATSLDVLGGVSKRMPVTGAFFLVGALGICALPPFNGFVSEFLIYVGMLDAVSVNQSVIAALFGITALALIGGLVVLAFTKLYGIAFLGSPRSVAVHQIHEVDPIRLVAMAILVAGIVVIGLFPLPFVYAVSYITGSLFDLPNAETVFRTMIPSIQRFNVALWVLIGVSLILWVWRWLALRKRPTESGPTWGCGFTAPTPKMQYSGESFSEGLQSLARNLTKNSGERVDLAREEIFPMAHHFEAKHKDKIDSLFTAWWVEFTRRLNARLSVLRTGKVNHYILYALLFLALILVLSLLQLIK